MSKDSPKEPFLIRQRALKGKTMRSDLVGTIHPEPCPPWQTWSRGSREFKMVLLLLYDLKWTLCNSFSSGQWLGPG